MKKNETGKMAKHDWQKRQKPPRLQTSAGALNILLRKAAGLFTFKSAFYLFTVLPFYLQKGSFTFLPFNLFTFKKGLLLFYLLTFLPLKVPLFHFNPLHGFLFLAGHLGQVDRQDAVVDLGLDFILVNVVRQEQRLLVLRV